MGNFSPSVERQVRSLVTKDPDTALAAASARRLLRLFARLLPEDRAFVIEIAEHLRDAGETAMPKLRLVPSRAGD